MSRPFITVITPTFNRADYLEETMDSVLSQGAFDIEYIIIDDGSQDETATLVRQFIERKSGKFRNANIEYLYHSNVGETRSVNRGLSLVRGKYFAIVNSDDPLLPGSFTKVIRALEVEPAALAAYPDWNAIDHNSEMLHCVRMIDYDIRSLIPLGHVSIGPGACFRSSVIQSVGFRNPLLRYSADLDFWYRLALLGPIVHVPEPLATHRIHPTSASVSERGSRLALETAYLYSVYARHPLLSGRERLIRLGDANGQFAALFASSDLRHAIRFLCRSFSSDPLAALRRCIAVGPGPLSDLFASLGATRSGLAEPFFAKMLSAASRADAFSSAARGLLLDPLGMITFASTFGGQRLIDHVSCLPARGFRKTRR